MAELDSYTVKVAFDCDRVLKQAQFIRAIVEELLRRPYRPQLPPLLPMRTDDAPR